MDKFLDMVNENLSAGEINKTMLRLFFSKVSIWDYAKILKTEYKNLSKDKQLSLLKFYYDMLIRVGQEGKFVFSVV